MTWKQRFLGSSIDGREPRNLVAWSVLVLLLVANLAGALTFDHEGWPSFVGDEATYSMQGASLAFDFDLSYEREDYDRFVETWGRTPDGLILQSRNAGEDLTFGKPSPYALWSAPFIRFWPRRGPIVANALWLILVGFAVASTLERRLGPWAPLWVATFLFASVAFAYTFWIHADLFLMGAVALAFAAVYRGSESEQKAPEEIYGERRTSSVGAWFWFRWIASGLLLGAVVAFRPFYASLLLPVLFVAPRPQRRRAIGAFLGAAAAALLLVAASAWLAGGSWTTYGGERGGFYAWTGFPDVDFPAEDWKKSIERWGNTSWIHSETLDFDISPRLIGWDAAYFLAGRHVGVLPYFLPLLLALVAFRRGEGRGILLLAIGLAILCFFIVRPFNFWGGRGAIANRYFLPIYPAIWFLAARVRRPWTVLGPVLVLLASAPFLWTLWLQPRAFPVSQDGSYRHVSPQAVAWLPYETTQSHIGGLGGEDAPHGDLWLRFVGKAVRPVGDGRVLTLAGDRSAELLVGAQKPVASFTFNFGPEAANHLEVEGWELASTLARPDGGITFVYKAGKADRRHRMWWGSQDHYLYLLKFRMTDAVPDQLTSLRIGASYREALD